MDFFGAAVIKLGVTKMRPLHRRSSRLVASFAGLMLAAGLGLAPLARAQGLTGQVSGTVRDPGGRPVPGAVTTLANASTGQSRSTPTNDSGDFAFTELLPGMFDLSVTSPGFKRFEQKGIVLSSTERRELNAISLEIGAVSETISVEATATPLQVESAERSGLVDSHEMQELSLKGRDYLGMMKLLPGVFDANNATREAPGGSTLQGIYINGNRQGSLNLTLDGISTMDTGGGTGPYMQASIDAVAEVKVLLTNYQAEYGRSSGGTINTITKSGTRDLRGGAYYYFRNEDLNANDFFANRSGLARPSYRFNYPGYFLGGPVRFPGTGFNRHRNKLFFFWSQEFLPRTSPTSVTFQTFPTALERKGDFSQSLDQNGKLIAVRDPLSNAPFPGNVVPANRISAAGQALLNLFPLPNTIDPTHTYNYAFQSPLQQPRNDQILRTDWNISPGTQFYARGIKDYQAIKGGFGFSLASPSWPQLPIQYEIHAEGILGTLIHTFSPSSVIELTFGVNRGLQTVQPLASALLAANQRSSLGGSLPQFFPQANPSGVVPNATFGGVSDAPQLNIDQRYPYFGANNVWQISSNYSLIRGSHNLKFGIYTDLSRKNFQLASNFNGLFAFDRDSNNPLDSGYAFSNALIGSVDSYTESTQHPAVHARDTNIEWYGQDAWRVAHNFTIDAGVRFYWIQPTSSAGTQLATFDSSVYSASQQPPLIQPYIDPATGVREGRDPITGQILPVVKIGSFSSAGGTPNQGMQVYNQTILKTPAVQLAPRVGAAWDVFGNTRTAVRAGFGIFYDRIPQNQVGQFLVEPPLVNTPTANYTTIASLLSTPLSLSPNSVFGIQRDFKPPAVYNWSFGVQQSIGFGAVLDVAYVGDVSRHGMQYRNLNATKYGTNFLTSSLDPTLSGGKPLPVNFLRPTPGYADIQYMEFASNSNYNALQAQVTKRLSSRLTFHASYTWSKVLDVADTPTSVVNPVLPFTSRNYGPASFDRRQNMAINYVFAVPEVSRYWDNRISRLALDGWEISSIVSFIAGPPLPVNYTFVTATDVTGASGAGIDSRVDLSCNPNLAWGDRTIDRGFDTSCVHAPTKAGLGIGNASKYPIVGPGVNNWDVSLFKNFRLRSETRRLQFRLETYNTFNHAQFTALDNNARFDAAGNQVNLNLGRYNAAAPGRRVALGLKLYF
jgi:hypothetical protein